jgi:hypothetical protein
MQVVGWQIGFQKKGIDMQHTICYTYIYKGGIINGQYQDRHLNRKAPI